MRLLITGARGFLGLKLADAILRKGMLTGPNGELTQPRENHKPYKVAGISDLSITADSFSRNEVGRLLAISADRLCEMVSIA